MSHQVERAIALQQLLANLQRERSELLLAMVADNLQEPRLVTRASSAFLDDLF